MRGQSEMRCHVLLPILPGEHRTALIPDGEAILRRGAKVVVPPRPSGSTTRPPGVFGSDTSDLTPSDPPGRDAPDRAMASSTFRQRPSGRKFDVRRTRSRPACRVDQCEGPLISSRVAGPSLTGSTRRAAFSGSRTRGGPRLARFGSGDATTLLPRVFAACLPVLPMFFPMRRWVNCERSEKAHCRPCLPPDDLLKPARRLRPVHSRRAVVAELVDAQR